MKYITLNEDIIDISKFEYVDSSYILNTLDERIIAVNEVGKMIIENCKNITIDKLFQKLKDSFPDIQAEVIERDAIAFVDELFANGLVSIREKE